MRDPKFEQEVQRKMHDLEFVPSESVWAGIQRGIVPRERRRVAAILWWLFPGMVLLAGGIVMYRHSASTGVVTSAAPVHGGSDAAGSSGSSGGSGAAGSGKTDGGMAEAVGGSARGNKVDGSVAGSKVATRAVGGVMARSGGKDQLTNRTGVESTADGVANVVANVAVDGSMDGSSEGMVAAKRGSVLRFHPGLIGGLAARAGVRAPGFVLRPVNPAVTGIRQPRHPWLVGFNFGGGGSSIYSAAGNALVSLSSYNNNVAASSYSYNNTSQPPRVNTTAFALSASGSKRNATGVKVDYSYWAGIYGEKSLSARLSVDIGLNLHYYSVLLQTANPVSPYPPTSASLFVNSAVTYSLNSSAANSANSGQSYVNSYYFLELPLTVQWKLNHSRSLPVYWRGGAVFSYLMSSNGLYYDASSGTYKSDNGAVRRPQAGVNSGLMVGLPVRGVQIQAGPEIQYALSSMLTNGSGGGHMMYGGMRVALMR